MEKAVSRYKVDLLVTSLLSFHILQFSLAYANFVLKGKNAANVATEECMQTFDA